MNILKWFFRQGPKAKLVRAKGDHVANLAALDVVDIQPVSEVAGLPVWIEVGPDKATTQTYLGLFWEIEPMGEYLYYLAGDFSKNEKGLLRYGSAQTSAEVHVNFEDDVISVNRLETKQWSGVAEEDATDGSDFGGMTVGEVTSFAQDRSQAAGYERCHARLDVGAMQGGLGYVELANEGSSRPWVRLVWCKHTETEQGPRVTSIVVSSVDAAQKFDALFAMMKDLIGTYHDISDQPLTGAIRM